ncbi:MAG: urate hydroxylase PuuD [Planctomycetes bacterium]|nr:urate hydroxylase PuuD [Planctomycetota bacterium]
MELFTQEGVYFLLRWLHFLAGIVWIGLLYYFNFVQTPFFATAEAPVRSGMIRGLVPSALWWFRWGAMITFLSGWAYIGMKMGLEKVPHGSAYMTLIMTGGLLGTVMWANVWFVIWPNQKVVIANANQTATGGQPIPDAANRGKRAGLASRTNTALSIPMLFFMGAASHLQSLGDKLARGEGMIGAHYGVLLLVIVAMEFNALSGLDQPRQKILSTVKGAITLGFILSAVMYFSCEVFI